MTAIYVHKRESFLNTICRYLWATQATPLPHHKLLLDYYSSEDVQALETAAPLPMVSRQDAGGSTEWEGDSLRRPRGGAAAAVVADVKSPVLKQALLTAQVAADSQVRSAHIQPTFALRAMHDLKIIFCGKHTDCILGYGRGW